MKRNFGKIAVAIVCAAFTMSFAQSVTSGDDVLKDKRDGKTYKTVKIGDKTWMAENLNYKTKGSMCYDNQPEKCEKYGSLYSWKVAQKACPTGWRLPTKADLEALKELAAKTAGNEDDADISLKSDSGWKNDKNGKNLLGFNAIPAGVYDEDDAEGQSPFSSENGTAYFWSSNQDKEADYSAYYLGLFTSDAGRARVSTLAKYYGMSVRCVKK